jgi:8-oxo-dGTP pyrophosphatase MutT (NUDIX family)
LIRFPTRAFLAYASLRRGMTLGVRAAVFDAEGRILLIRHGYVAGWHMPGGGVERGETMRVSLERELIEEAGVALTGPAALFGMYWNRRGSPRDHVGLYVCRQWRQDAPPPRNLEIVDSGFFAADALPEETTPATRRRLAEIAGEIEPSEMW